MSKHLRLQIDRVFADRPQADDARRGDQRADDQVLSPPAVPQQIRDRASGMLPVGSRPSAFARSHGSGSRRNFIVKTTSNAGTAPTRNIQRQPLALGDHVVAGQSVLSTIRTHAGGKIADRREDLQPTQGA